VKQIAAVALLLGITPAAAAQDFPTPTPLTRAQNAFAAGLYGKLRQQPGNIFFSPYSISTSLGMVYAGAKGGTATEMQKMLHLNLLPGADLRAAYLTAEKSQPSFADPQAADLQLHVANALWGAVNYSFNVAYLADIKNNFGGTLQPVDFGDEPATRDRINDWVSNHTTDKIQNLIPLGVLTGSTRLVLTNAIYFKDKWIAPFDKDETRQAPFHLSGGHEIPAQMMNKLGKFPLSAQPGVRILTMPYNDGASMEIILPDRNEGLAAIEANLTAAELNAWLQNGPDTRVSLSLPKFKATSEFDLGTVLPSLGMKRAFEPSQADLTGIATDPRHPLYVSDVIHKAFVEVNENGTEAAAATGAVITSASMTFEFQSPPVPFIADHPFIYVIRSDQTGDILFIGRVTDPTK